MCITSKRENEVCSWLPIIGSVVGQSGGKGPFVTRQVSYNAACLIYPLVILIGRENWLTQGYPRDPKNFSCASAVPRHKIRGVYGNSQ